MPPMFWMSSGTKTQKSKGIPDNADIFTQENVGVVVVFLLKKQVGFSYLFGVFLFCSVLFGLR